jgi:hypothetical protein
LVTWTTLVVITSHQFIRGLTHDDNVVKCAVPPTQPYAPASVVRRGAGEVGLWTS